MKLNRLLLVFLALLVVALGVLYSLNGLEHARRPAREIRALSVAHDLINKTNSTLLDGTSQEFTADLASILTWPTWREIDRSPPRDARAVVRLVLTNDHGQALHMRLRDEYPSGHLRLLSYRRITEPGGPANRSQPAGSETNRTSAAAGSGG
jgi:hypothetical protein